MAVPSVHVLVYLRLIWFWVPAEISSVGPNQLGPLGLGHHVTRASTKPHGWIYVAASCLASTLIAGLAVDTWSSLSLCCLARSKSIRSMVADCFLLHVDYSAPSDCRTSYSPNGLLVLGFIKFICRRVNNEWASFIQSLVVFETLIDKWSCTTVFKGKKMTQWFSNHLNQFYVS